MKAIDLKLRIGFVVPAFDKGGLERKDCFA
jgi:hypothetical protein